MTPTPPSDGPAAKARASAEASATRSEAALRVLRAHLAPTPAFSSPWLGEATGAEVVLKGDHLQQTGSFKVRGALFKALRLPAGARAVTASTGNHGAAMAFACSHAGLPLRVFVPKTASPSKIERLERRGAEVVLEGADCTDAEAAARAAAAADGSTYVSPYNDDDIVAGQGTLVLELLQQFPALDTLVVAVGGGGLAAGCAAVLKHRNPSCHVIGCSPVASAVMRHSVAAGEILDLPSEPTLSDGTAGGVEAGSVTFDLCRDLIDDWVLLEEHEIAQALAGFVDHHGQLIEGAAATAVAATLRLGDALRGRHVGVVLCGANIGSDDLERALRQAREG